MKQLVKLIVTLKVFLLYALICISGVVLGNVPSHPIYVSKAGDGWDLKIDSAITLIKNIDSVKYSRLLHVCTNVDFWAGKFSSNDGDKTILVSVNDIKLNSVNNLAAILIHESIYEQFKTEFIKQVQQLKVGDPFEADTKIGALVSEGHINKVKSYIDLAIQEGGTVLCGGNLVHPQGACEKGYFLEPTVIEGLSNNCRTNQEEIFGPVVTLQSFSDEAEAISLANGTTYGLAANIWTEHLSKAHRVSAALDFGIVWVNCWLLRDLRTPFGGVKHSGVGREGGFEVLRFFTEPKNVCIKI